ncbi:uncharacterized protein LOC117019879 [Rhinolophus ferrumequinum]|uniref:uncharacterized protein LOC117019879 n=1 Tax=Rhinolophus ferrumequinum TaxID=59479 RepID=UPI00140F5B74|nr:uncharacterized protein LOC117019879 [Rhinolophus ferrumequinum]
MAETLWDTHALLASATPRGGRPHNQLPSRRALPMAWGSGAWSTCSPVWATTLRHGALGLHGDRSRRRPISLSTSAGTVVARRSAFGRGQQTEVKAQRRSVHRGPRAEVTVRRKSGLRGGQDEEGIKSGKGQDRESAGNRRQYNRGRAAKTAPRSDVRDGGGGPPPGLVNSPIQSLKTPRGAGVVGRFSHRCCGGIFTGTEPPSLSHVDGDSWSGDCFLQSPLEQRIKAVFSPLGRTPVSTYGLARDHLAILQRACVWRTSPSLD